MYHTVALTPTSRVWRDQNVLGTADHSEALCLSGNACAALQTWTRQGSLSITWSSHPPATTPGSYSALALTLLHPSQQPAKDSA